jgi:hypothetical protein
VLQQQVCEAAPFDARAMMPNQLQLSAFIAGFALAAFVLLLDRGGDKVDDERAQGHAIGALLLALAAIVGLVASFMFSSVTGEPCLNSRLQFDFPTMLMAVAALMMVSGISVAAASQARLGATANALRLCLVVGGIMICARFFGDYVASDAASRRYDAFLERVEQLAPDDMDPGRTATMDAQLALYAEDRWPGREEEWPGLLAEDLMSGPSSTGLVVALGIVAGIAATAALAFRLSTAAAAHTGDPRTVADAEERWRRWVSRLTVVGVGIVVALFSNIAATGDLIRRPPWVGVLLFGAVAMIFGLVIQPPLVAGQSSLFDRALARLRPHAPRVAPTDVADVPVPATVDLRAAEAEPTG